MRGFCFVTSLVACAAYCGGPASAADVHSRAPTPYATLPDTSLPAVDGFNGKVDALGGTLRNQNLYGGEASLSGPLGHRFGFQLDGAGGSLGGKTFESAAAHVFWRDPTVGLLGGYGSYTNWDKFGGVFLQKYGVEGAWYAGRWTLEGVAGVESGSQKTDITDGISTTIDLTTRGFDKISLSYYLHDNFKLSVGHVYTGGRNALVAGGEWGFDVGSGTMGALFTEGRFGEAGNNGVYGGLKFYFGQRNKSLIRRNREDDPPTTTGDNLAGLTGGIKNSSPTPTAPACAPPNQLFNGRCIDGNAR